MMQCVLIFSIFRNFHNIQIQTFKRNFLIFLIWAKEKMKQKGSIKFKEVKPFNLFTSGSGGVGKLLQYRGGSPEKP